MAKLKIACLGSSFAAGAGIAPVVNSEAMRSGRNYGHILAKRLDATLIDLSSSGATLENLLDTPQEVGESSVPPQIDGLPADVDIVTITAGGNDIGYSFGMVQDSLAAISGPIPSALQMSEPYEPIDTPTLQRRLAAVVDKVTIVAPKATIYLVEYPNVFGACTQAEKDTPLNEDRMQQYVRMGQMLTATYRSVADSRVNVEIIPMSDLSKGHEVGSERPYVFGFSVTDILSGSYVPYHPTAASHEASAEALYQYISRKS